MAFEHDYKAFPELTNRQINDFGLSSPHKQYTEDFTATCVKVIDGDTITLATEDRDFEFPLRLLNIDALELSEGGDEAKEFMIGQIEGEEVEIKINPKNRVGKFGRLLGRVQYGLDMGEALMRVGLAVPFGQKNEGAVPDVNKIFKKAGVP